MRSFQWSVQGGLARTFVWEFTIGPKSRLRKRIGFSLEGVEQSSRDPSLLHKRNRG